MIIVNISGGLGNQMFQYAFGYAISKKNNEILKLDISNYDTYNLRNYELWLFNINAELASKEEVKKFKYKNENILNKIIRKLKKNDILLSDKYYSEHDYNLSDNSSYRNVYFDGYWQSEKYFKEYKKDLLKQFSLRKKIHQKSQEFEQMIKTIESVSLHVRHGDYITNLHTNSVHGTVSLEYYKNAIIKIEENVKNTHYFIFSDDLHWAKKNLGFINNITFIEFTEDTPVQEEIYLMSQCKHNIIANSSFSWWGAWLNQNNNKIIIAPMKWFNDISRDTDDLIPKEWIRL